MHKQALNFFSKNIIGQEVSISSITSNGINMSMDIKFVAEEICLGECFDDKTTRLVINNFINLYFNDYEIVEDCPSCLDLYLNRELVAEVCLSENDFWSV